MSTIVERIHTTVERFFDDQRVERTAAVAVAFSGGSDSLALLCAVCALFGANRTHALYVNHHLRSSEELAAEIQLNEQNCRLLGVPFTVLDLGEGSVAREADLRGRGVEEAARQMRYEILGRICQARSIPYLLTAHNSDDQLETLLMRFAQASSLSALAGIRRRRDLGTTVVLRPLLEVSHQDLADYVSAHGLSWAVDSTNDEDTYLRNAIRRRVKKPLLELFPNARAAAGVLSTRFEQTSRLLDTLVATALEGVACAEGAVSFTHAWYLGLTDGLRELLLYRLVALVGAEGRIAHSLIVELTRSIEAFTPMEAGQREVGSLLLVYEEGTFTLSASTIPWSYCLNLTDPKKVQRIALPDNIEVAIRAFDEAYWDKDALRLDASALVDPVIRTPQSGDEIVLKGGRVRVGKLISSMKVAAHRRAMVPILVDRSGVVAIFAAAFGGRDRIAERFKAPLAHAYTNIYSSNRRDMNSEI